MRSLPVLMILVLIGGGAQSQEKRQADPVVAIQPAGLMIIQDVFPEDESLRAFLQFPVTRASLLLQMKEFQFVKIDTNRSRLESFTDDRGTDLMSAQPKFDSFINSFPRISRDGHGALVEFASGGFPAKGASELRLKARLEVQAGKEREVQEQKDVELKKGAKWEAGPVHFVVEEIGNPNWDKYAMMVRIKSENYNPRCSEIRFFDETGKEVESRKDAWLLNGSSANFTYNLKTKVETCTVRIWYWKEIKKFTLPVDVKVSIGL